MSWESKSTLINPHSEIPAGETGLSYQVTLAGPLLAESASEVAFSVQPTPLSSNSCAQQLTSSSEAENKTCKKPRK